MESGLNRWAVEGRRRCLFLKVATTTSKPDHFPSTADCLRSPWSRHLLLGLLDVASSHADKSSQQITFSFRQPWEQPLTPCNLARHQYGPPEISVLSVKEKREETLKTVAQRAKQCHSHLLVTWKWRKSLFQRVVNSAWREIPQPSTQHWIPVSSPLTHWNTQRCFCAPFGKISDSLS